jgi:hypothetical protein
MKKSIMEISNIKELLNRETEIDSEFIHDTFNYWINGHEYARSPFPDYIIDELINISKNRFYTWSSELDISKRKEYDKEKLIKVLEGFIFETAFELVKNKDEKITICYPFLPRKGDTLKEPEVKETNEDENAADSKIFKREIVKENDTSYLKLFLRNNTTGDLWETKFLLPEENKAPPPK